MPIAPAAVGQTLSVSITTSQAKQTLQSAPLQESGFDGLGKPVRVLAVAAACTFYFVLGNYARALLRTKLV